MTLVDLSEMTFYHIVEEYLSLLRMVIVLISSQVAEKGPSCQDAHYSSPVPSLKLMTRAASAHNDVEDVGVAVRDFFISIILLLYCLTFAAEKVSV